MTYHLLESEMKSITAFNAMALVWFSLGTLLLETVSAIIIGFGFASQPLSELGDFLFHKLMPFLVLAAAIVFGGGIYSVMAKRSQISLIRSETQRTTSV